MAYFGDLLSGRLNPNEDGLFSPDGNYYVKLTHRGVLPEGLIESTIWLWRVDDLTRAVNDSHREVVPPIALVVMRGDGNGSMEDTYHRGQTIKELHWRQDSTALFFRAERPTDANRLYEVSLSDRQVQQLTPDDQDIDTLVFHATGILYTARPYLPANQTWISEGPGISDTGIGTGQSLIELLYPNWIRAVVKWAPSQLWRIDSRGPPSPIVDGERDAPVMLPLRGGSSPVFSVSPSGEHLVTTPYAMGVPEAWSNYEPGSRRPRARIASDGHDNLTSEALMRDSARAQQYTLVNLMSGKAQVLVNAPAASESRGWPATLQAVWAPDNRHVALAMTYMPVEVDPRANKTPCAVAVAEIGATRVQCLKWYSEPSDGASRIIWDSTGKRLTISPRASNESAPQRAEVFAWREGWMRMGAAPVPAAPPPPLRITVEQGLNEPPVLVGSNTRTGRTRRIFDPNPQLAKIDLGRASVYRWKDATGRELEGGLVWPLGYASGKRFPLVIQTHGFNPGVFLRTGSSETAAAARPLAARDMFVLQVKEPTGALGTSREAMEDGASVYLAAIDQLSADELVDVKKVGLTGFSRTGHYLMTSLIHAPDRFAAAVFANAGAGGTWGYLATLDYYRRSYAEEYRELYDGAKPYGAGLAAWLSMAPGFNMEKIRTPVLFYAGDPQHLLMATWEPYAMLRDQGKPVDLAYARSGRHGLVKPQQRLIHQEMIVDWFDFWLNDHEDSASGKARQYERWRELRATQDDRSADAPAHSIHH